MTSLASKLLLRSTCALVLGHAACAAPSTPPEGAAATGEATDSSMSDPSSSEGAEASTSGESTGSGACEAAGWSVGAVGSDAPAGFDGVFDREGRIWGLHVYATAGVSQAKLEHATAMLGEYIDNDENCEADDAAVLAALQSNQASMVMFATEAELEQNIEALEGAFGSVGLQDLYDEETHPNGAASGRFDAALEEVLHLVTHYGWSQAHAADFAERDSTLASAMDLARGGHFETVPASYPEAAWYHYDDTTCDYECMATEYFYWALTSMLGGQDFGSRCEEIAVEWEACTPEQFETLDVAMHELLTAKGYALPTVLPDGSYNPVPE